jgi:hypothetical protein
MARSSLSSEISHVSGVAIGGEDRGEIDVAVPRSHRKSAVAAETCQKMMVSSPSSDSLKPKILLSICSLLTFRSPVLIVRNWDDVDRGPSEGTTV